MIRSLALALGLLALLLAAPAWFPHADAQTPESTELEARVSLLEEQMAYVYSLALPPPVATDQHGLLPDAAFYSADAFVIVCKAGVSSTAGQRVLQPPSYCVRPAAPAMP